MRFWAARLPRPCTFTPPLRTCARWKHTRHLDMANIQVNKTAHPFDKARFEALLNRRFFYAPAFEIYGGEYPIASNLSISMGVCALLGGERGRMDRRGLAASRGISPIHETVCGGVMDRPAGCVLLVFVKYRSGVSEV
ncbi:hypothetical protein OH77DRAFT_718806 [Trametes cingulata]|nr:hypothetical protein OH77DRAFT_718806 [Trametes cingulata]